jgi:hypothetical protein
VSWWSGWGAALGAVVAIIGGVSGALYRTHPRASVVSLLLLGSLLTVVLPTAAVAGRAHELADDVLAGYEVAPFSLANVPVLDISAVRVEVTWIGAPEQRPAMFGTTSAQPTEGLLLGQSSGTVILAIPVEGAPSRIVRLPSSSVAIVTA